MSLRTNLSIAGRPNPAQVATSRGLPKPLRVPIRVQLLGFVRYQCSASPTDRHFPRPRVRWEPACHAYLVEQAVLPDVHPCIQGSPRGMSMLGVQARILVTARACIEYCLVLAPTTRSSKAARLRWWRVRSAILQPALCDGGQFPLGRACAVDLGKGVRHVVPEKPAARPLSDVGHDQ